MSNSRFPTIWRLFAWTSALLPQEAVVHGRIGSRLAADSARPVARLVGSRAQDMQNANRRLLSLAWAKAHGMTLMVQDLSNPMLAQIPHVQLAAHAGTIMGVETNGMQFYPAVSEPEGIVHPGLYRRRNGRVSLSTLRGSGFGYRLDEIAHILPEPAATFV